MRPPEEALFLQCAENKLFGSTKSARSPPHGALAYETCVTSGRLARQPAANSRIDQRKGTIFLKLHLFDRILAIKLFVGGLLQYVRCVLANPP